MPDHEWGSGGTGVHYHILRLVSPLSSAIIGAVGSVVLFIKRR